MDRRSFLTQGAMIGCSLAASPLMTPVSFAATPGDARLVVIILRGGMDGLGVVAPYGDPDFAALGRPVPDFSNGAMDLDGRFALHPALSPLRPLWQAGELGFAHAVSIPYRDKRSHFDGQDLLEAGVAENGGPLPPDGWLNRVVQNLPGATADSAYAIGGEPLRILSGPAQISRWTPEADLHLSPQAILLTRRVMQSDPAMAAALDSAFALAGSDGDALAFTGGTEDMMAAMQDDMMSPRARRRPGVALAAFAAQQLREQARIACFSLMGWDTHKGQARGLSNALGQLADTLTTLKQTLDASAWERTTVAAVTEFGRTVRMNGSGGTDHGTGGAMILAGGALRGRRVLTEWPGLDEASLYEGRDLKPTRDMRAYLAWLLRGQFGLARSTLETGIFPGLDMGEDPGLLL
ncbi:DUF1501 domain-containing protein [Mameliella alba]|nr:DUF1501 domain-containing protein [Antarctobacter heliothermus]MBY6142919.1 DUF1501 domain-containing protein [Mameliella alba]MCA0953356.1 DUF1501 domain-containing protein [Mameliella alba]